MGTLIAWLDVLIAFLEQLRPISPLADRHRQQKAGRRMNTPCRLSIFVLRKLNGRARFEAIASHGRMRLQFSPETNDRNEAREIRPLQVRPTPGQ
jgi:hypothetical protein